MVEITLCGKKPLDFKLGQSVITISKEEQEKFVNPSTENITVLPDLGKVLGKVEVGAVTSNIDKNIVSRNIRAGISILGVDGDLEPDKPDQEKTIIPTKERQEVTADSGYELAKTIVEPIPDNFIEPTGVFEIEENGEYDITEYKTLVSNVPAREDLDAELNEQDELITELDGKIDELPDREIDLSEATATAEDVLVGKKIYNVDGELVEGTYKDMLQQRVDDTKSCYYLFNRYPLATIPFLNKLDTSKVTDMRYMFNYCQNLTSLDVSNFNTSNVTDMSYMFNYCQNLTSLDLSNFNTSNVTSMHQMFNNCTYLTSLDLSNFDTSNVTNMSYMFVCRSLTSLDVSSFNTSNVTNMSQMFYYCDKLTSLDLSNFDTSNVTNMSQMFNYCQNLTSLDLSNFDTSNVTSMHQMFTNCSNLNIILGELNLIKGPSTSSMFERCKQLKTVTLKNIKLSLYIGSSKKDTISSSDYGRYLTNETLTNTIQELWDNTDNALGGSRTLQIGYANTQKTDVIYVKLIEVTDEMIANDPYIANKKPCVVCESTDEGAMTLTEYAILKNWSIA